MKTSRRNVLRGSVLAGAAAVAGAGAMSAPRSPKLHTANAKSANL
ncbi:MAG: twin-arginine translocation signal domain-containing protein, partial [Pseudomonadota bacterium]